MIDCRGKYLIPGLWDMHVHGAFHPWLLTLSAVNGVLEFATWECRLSHC